KRKHRKVTWAAMRFLQAAIQKNQRRMRIEDLLLLLLRCALIALLALAMARPVLRAASGWFNPGRSTAVLIIDHSFSMDASDGVQSRFDQAKEAAISVIDTLPTGSSVAVLAAGEGVTPVIAEPTHDLNLAREVIRQMERGDSATDLLPAVNRAAEILAARSINRGELYVITDRQQLGFRRLDKIRQTFETLPDTVARQVVLVGDALDR